MSVTRIHEDPRVTKPYTDEQWAEIEALGHQVDADLRRRRAADHGRRTDLCFHRRHGRRPNGTPPRWAPTNTGERIPLLRRLRDRFAPGGLLHHGQGKWYPGESLPRWALGLYWRKDGEPIWRDRRSGCRRERTPGRAYGRRARRPSCSAWPNDWASIRHADARATKTSGTTCGKSGGCRSTSIRWTANLEIRRTASDWPRSSSRGLGQVVGYALPSAARVYTRWKQTAWTSGAWFFRAGEMFLVPGDSPMGYRLPLDSIPWVQRVGISASFRARPDGGRGRRLPSRARPVAPASHCRSARGGGSAGLRGAGSGAGANPSAPTGARIPPIWLRRGANPLPGSSALRLCTEVRGGVLRVFMPPQQYLEDYLELVAAIEDTAAESGLPVLIEGYTPPHDPRLNAIKVTPDPGVIEVNMHPAASWDELVKNTTALYEEARLSRLATEKFMLDGRHTGTGGGNHIVVGGPISRRTLRCCEIRGCCAA